MTQDLTYRNLSRAEIKKFQELDRRESINGIYFFENGKLRFKDQHHMAPDWSMEEKQRRIAYLQKVYDRGATFFGAFAAETLVGLAVLDHNLLTSRHKRVNLEGLWVSSQYRNQSIGRTLFQLAVKEAFTRGAESVYVSATPTENTVRFYRGLGCSLADPVDPQLLDKEPDDIHLELVLLQKSRHP